MIEEDIWKQLPTPSGPHIFLCINIGSDERFIIFLGFYSGEFIHISPFKYQILLIKILRKH